MALKDCLYCKESISEFAAQCPKCYQPDPFNSFKLEAHLKKERLDKLLDTEHIRCNECNTEIKARHVFSKPYTCKNCGFPITAIECFNCDEPATDYDFEKEQFLCFYHLPESCYACGEAVVGSEKKYIREGPSYGGSWTYIYCKKCYSEIKYKKINCFIATACYDDNSGYEVTVLRKFRNEYLMKSFVGRLFVKIYSLFSPPFAKWLSSKAAISQFIRRNILDRLVKVIVRCFSKVKDDSI